MDGRGTCRRRGAGIVSKPLVYRSYFARCSLWQAALSLRRGQASVRPARPVLTIVMFFVVPFQQSCKCGLAMRAPSPRVSPAVAPSYKQLDPSSLPARTQSWRHVLGTHQLPT